MTRPRSFETLVLPHLDAAYNLARWLLRNESAAEDAVQDASIKAFRHFDSLRGEDARPWLLGIVRNTCFTVLARQRKDPEWVEFDEDELVAAADTADDDGRSDPATQLERKRAGTDIDAAIRALSPLLREVIVLREFEDLEYAQIAKIAAIPIGTVMSRLARAREKLRGALSRTDMSQ